MQNKLNRSALSALVATMLAVPAWAAPMPDDAAVQLLQRVNDLEQELRNIRGDNEKLQNELETVRKSQKENFQQVDDRLEKLTVTDKGTDKATDATLKPDVKPDTPKPDSLTADKPVDKDPNGFYSYGTGKSDDKNPATPLNKTEDKPANKTDDKTDSKTVDAPAADKEKTGLTTTDKTALPEQAERSVYDHAFQTLLKDPKESVPEFRTFLKDYPHSSLAPSAQYWVGEALYADKDFKGAIEEFLVVLKEHKGSDKAPDAALKLGYSFYELKEWDKARKTLEDVISFFPGNAETTRMAKERLDKMKTEGH